MTHLRRRVVRSAPTALVMLVVTALIYMGVSYLISSIEAGPPSHLVPHSDHTPTPEPVNPFASGTYLIAYAVVSSSCGWSTQVEVMENLANLRTTLLREHEQDFAHIAVHGVALDENIEQGFRFLSDIEELSESRVFDEVSVGSSWLNELIVRVVWREELMAAATPSLLLVVREVDSSSYLDEGQILVGNDRVLAAHVGGIAIGTWVQSGTPLP